MPETDSRGLRVIWATDGSASAIGAVPLLRQLVLPVAEKVHVLTVAPHHLLAGARPDPSFIVKATRSARNREMTAGRLQAQRDLLILDPGDVPAQAVARWGYPAEEVLRALAALKADLLVIGARGHSALKLLLLGSVTQAVVQHATRPVLVARPGSQTLKTIVVGYDGSVPAKKAVRFLSRLALPSDARIVLACVVEPFAVPPTTPAPYRKRALEEAQAINLQRHHHAEQAVRAIAGEMAAEGMTLTPRVLAGPAAEELMAVVKEEAADLVVVGSRKPAAARHYLLGSTAEKLVRHSPSSVLVVR